jgi:predicted RNase H-like HicB family nuclease
MRTGSGTNSERPTGTTITLTREADWWVAKDEATGVTSQGKSRHDALENLDEALQGYRGEGEAPSDDTLREVGIDPEQNSSESVEDAEIFE